MLNSQLADESITLEEQIEAIQQGDKDLENQLLKNYQPFIAKCVSEVCKRYIYRTTDDEFSIGLMAFNEAMHDYSPNKGATFLSFARLVIKRKVIDFIRKEKRQLVTTSLDMQEHDEQLENPMEIQASKTQFKAEEDSWNRKQEIQEFSKKLKEYHLSFSELTVISPKHQDARESAIRVAKVLYNDAKLREYVFKKKKIPIKALLNHVEVSKKTLERNRKYTLAIFLILSGDYVYLKDYLKEVDL
nr:RNA polymerase sigma factor SigI [Saliterribacillus persicus]